MKVVWIVVGGVLVVVALADAVSTLVTTRTRKGQWWPTAAFYRLAWPPWRKVGRRIKELERRERMLGAFGPVSLLCLLVIWVGLEIIGWGFVWYGLRASFEGIDSVVESWYFAGVNFFTVGFGDILPLSGWTRILAVCSAFTGVITTALVVGFLPTLYSAYSDREAELLTVDDLSGTYVTRDRAHRAERARRRRHRALPEVRGVGALGRPGDPEPLRLPDARDVPLAARRAVVAGGPRHRDRHRRDRSWRRCEASSCGRRCSCTAAPPSWWPCSATSST